MNFFAPQLLHVVMGEEEVKKKTYSYLLIRPHHGAHSTQPPISGALQIVDQIILVYNWVTYLCFVGFLFYQSAAM